MKWSKAGTRREEFFTMQESPVTLVNRIVREPENRDRVFGVIADKERFGYAFDRANASLELLVARTLNGKKLPFNVTDYHISMRGCMGKGSVCEASLKVLIRGAELHRVSEGSGPVNALDGALRIALGESSFPHLDKTRLIDWQGELVPGTQTGTEARTRIFVTTTDGHRTWRTIGVSENVIEASLIAVVDSLEYALMPKKTE